MKKIYFIFATLLFLIFPVIALAGCGLVESNNISDIRYGVFDAECESYNVTFTYGLREKPYYPDGIANTTVEFGIISVVFKERIEENETVYYNLRINDEAFSGTLEKSPYTEQYMADIGRICSDGDILSIEIYFNEDTNSEAIDLVNKNKDWNVNYKYALDSGLDALSDYISKIRKNKLSYEVHVKILNEQETNFGSYFWSVTIIVSDGQRHNVVFGTDSTDILLKN